MYNMITDTYIKVKIYTRQTMLIHVSRKYTTKKIPVHCSVIVFKMYPYQTYLT